ncbi:MAG: metallophosphoesterase, partial [Rhizobacter sp.]|nr:metallophosphoesterase [Chlorobiales bacterium]
MPPINFAGVLSFILLNLAIGYYITRKTAKFIDKVSVKRQKFFKRASALLITLSMLLFPASFIARNLQADAWLTVILFYASSLWFVWMMSMLIVFIPADVVNQFYHAAKWMVSKRRRKSASAAASEATLQQTSQTETFNPSRRNFLIGATAVGFAVPNIITAYSLFNNRMDYRINRMTMHFPNLPAELRGLKIAQVSDIHSGIYMSQRQMEGITEAVNAMQPDLITLTGDFVAGAKSEVAPFVQGFHNLKSTYGTFSCAGNHDEWLGMDLISEAMQQHDLGLLRNETKVLNIDGASLNVIGIDYTRGNESFLTSALESSAHEGFNLLLCHHPEFFPVAKSNHIDLMLAGHTHGGQIALDVAGVSVY